MAEYNSAHTGPEIDAAVSAVKTKQSAWDNKQDKITGKAGQVVGFDASGKPVAQEAPSGGGGASSWNDLKDKPVIMTGTPDTLTWDGNTEGLVSVMDMLYKVSDLTPTAEDIANGCFLTRDNGEPEAITFIVENGIFQESFARVAIVHESGVGVEVSGIVFPEKGIYLFYDGGFSTCSLTIPGYTGFGQEKIAPSHLYQPDWNQNDESAPDFVKNRPFYETSSVIYEASGLTQEYDNAMDAYITTVDTSIPLREGSTYKIVIDGVEYTSTCVVNGVNFIIGNGHISFDYLEDTGEPFVIQRTVMPEYDMDVSTIVYEGNDFSAVTIMESTVTHIDAKYLPTPSWNDLADKPFGETGTVILEEQTLVFNEESGAFVAELSATLKVGDTISVSYNGTVYECVGANAPNPEMPYVVFGNMAIMGGESDTGEPFCLLSVGTTAMIVNADMEAPVVKISFLCIEKLPLRFYDRQAVFYVSGSDPYLYTDAKLTTKATKADVVAAAKNMPIVISIGDVHFAPAAFVCAEGDYAQVYAGMPSTDKQLYFRLYCTAELTGS